MKMLKFITLKKKEIKIQGNWGLPCLCICNKTSWLFLVRMVHCHLGIELSGSSGIICTSNNDLLQ